MRSSVWRRPGSSSTMRILTTRARAAEGRLQCPSRVPATAPGSKSQRRRRLRAPRVPHGSTESLYDAGHDGETETGSLARFFGSEERIEDALRLAPRDAGSVVGDDQRDHFAELADRP